MTEYADFGMEKAAKEGGALFEFDAEIERLSAAIERLQTTIAPVVRIHDLEQVEASPRPVSVTDLHKRIEAIADLRRRVERITEKIDL